MTLPVLNIRPAPLVDLTPILRASSAAFGARGLPMWTQDALASERLRAQYPDAQGYLGWLEDQPVAAMILVSSDPVFWPEDPAAQRRCLKALTESSGGSVTDCEA